MLTDDLSGIEIRHLRALVTVADTASFSRAAVSLGYAQSAVSQQIAALERIVGERLIERSAGPKPVHPTAAGAVLIRHARRILSRLDIAAADLRALASAEAGRIRVGTFQSAGAHILPEVVREFRSRMPEVEIRFDEGADERTLLNAVAAGDLDLTFTLTTWLDPRFDAIDLVADPWVLLAPPDSPLRRRAPLGLDVLDELPMIVWTNWQSAFDPAGVMGRRGIHPDVLFTTNDNLTLQRLVGTGLGHTVVGSLAVERGESAGPAVPLPFTSDVAPRVIALAWARDRVRSAAVDAFIAAALAVGRRPAA
jgi:DNA-binding transcriptional LysR family regulator